MHIVTKLAATPLYIDEQGNGKHRLLHLRYNHRALKGFERESGRENYMDFLSEAMKTSRINAKELVALVWAGLYGNEEPVSIADVELWVNPGNMGQFSAVVLEALELAFKGPEEKEAASAQKKSK